MSEVKRTPRRAKPRALALLLFAWGAVFLFPGFARDYVTALRSDDGIYIPNARYEIPKSGGAVTHTFRVYNLRPRRLSVRAEPDCGCTGVSWQSATIAPFSWRDLTTTIEAKPQAARSVGIALRTDSRVRPFLFMFLVA